MGSDSDRKGSDVFLADNIRINITESDLLELVNLFEKLQDASQLESYAELRLVAEMKELGITATKFYKRFYLILQKRESEKLVKRVGIREARIDEAEALRLRIQAELEAEIDAGIPLSKPLPNSLAEPD